MSLETQLRQRRRERPILLMSHVVIGYPDLETSRALVESMVEAGVDAIELQIPFSEPMADGPVILRACHKALARGVSVAQCFDFVAELAPRLPIPVLFMSYYNLLFRRGVEAFAAQMRAAGAAGGIVPDLPLEEGSEYLAAMRRNKLDPVLLVAPNSTDERIEQVGSEASGMLYCVARQGITGANTDFSSALGDYLSRVRQRCQLPLGVGFGVKQPGDVRFLEGKADVAIVGSQTLRVLDESGVAGAERFVRQLAGRA